LELAILVERKSNRKNKMGGRKINGNAIGLKLNMTRGKARVFSNKGQEGAGNKVACCTGLDEHAVELRQWLKGCW
jgi:hypothetical protein